MLSADYFLKDASHKLGTYVLDPFRLLTDLNAEFLADHHTAIVQFSDGTTSVTFNLQKFLCSNWEVFDGRIRLGSKLLQIEGLTIHIGFKLQVDTIFAGIIADLD